MKMLGIVVKTKALSVKLAALALFLLSGCLSTMASSAEIPSLPAQAGDLADLKIIVIEGEGAINNVKQKTTRDLVIQVNDRNDHPVAGAVVTLTAPNQGAGGTFASNQNVLSLITGSDGRAALNTFEPNNIEGTFTVQIKASSEERVVTGTITQTNADMSSTAVTSAAALATRSQAGDAADLKLIIIEGEGAINNVKQRTAREVVIQVNDRNDRPVAGALVTVAAASHGTGGTLAGSKNVLSLVTGNDGRVAAHTFGSHNLEGTYSVQLKASSQGRLVTGTITQTNVRAAAPVAHRKRMTRNRAILIGAAVAASIAIALALHDGGYKPPNGSY